MHAHIIKLCADTYQDATEIQIKISDVRIRSMVQFKPG